MAVLAGIVIGGIVAISMLGGSLWFNAADLLLAHIPMGYLGAILAGATRSQRHNRALDFLSAPKESDIPPRSF